MCYFVPNLYVEVLNPVGMVCSIFPYGEMISEGAPLTLLISGRLNWAAATFEKE
jgi:hypothetical protein